MLMQFAQEVAPKVQQSLEKLQKDLGEVEARRKALKAEIKGHRKILAVLSGEAGRGSRKAGQKA